MDSAGICPHKRVFTQVNVIMVGAERGAKARVHVVGHMLDAAYRYVVRQKPVQLVYKITAVYLGVEIEM